MVQVIPHNPRGGALSGFLGGLSKTLPDAFAAYSNRLQREADEAKKASQLTAENAALSRQGFNVSGVVEPTTRAALLKEQAKRQSQQSLIDSLGLGSRPSSGAAMVGRPSNISDEKIMSPEARKLLDAPQNVMQEEQPLAQRLSEDQIAQLSVLSPQTATILERQRSSASKAQASSEKELRRRFESDRDYESRRSLPILQENDKERAALPIKQNALREMKSAIREDNLGGLSLDYLADVTGFEPFRSAAGAKFKTAGKEYFLRSISRAGARPNQWIEQQIGDMMPKIGRSKEANLGVAELIGFENDLEAKRVELVDRLAQEDQDKFGYVKGDVGRRADQAMKSYTEKRQKQLAYSLRQIQEEAMGDDKLRNLEHVPKGTPLTEQMGLILLERYGDKAEKAAKQMGFSIPEIEDLNQEVSP